MMEGVSSSPLDPIPRLKHARWGGGGVHLLENDAEMHGPNVHQILYIGYCTVLRYLRGMGKIPLPNLVKSLIFLMRFGNNPTEYLVTIRKIINDILTYDVLCPFPPSPSMWSLLLLLLM